MTGADVSGTPVTRSPPPGELSADALDARRDAGESFPIVDGDVCMFGFCGPVISVRLVHFGVGLPDDLRFEQVGDSDWWLLSLRFPHGARLEYKLDVTDSFGTRLVEDPLNANTANHPFGANSVCEADGYVEPDWAVQHLDVPTGTIRAISLDSAALGRRMDTSVYLPAGFTDVPDVPYRVLVVHDGGDYLRYASATTVLDNLIHDGAIPPTVAAFLNPGERLVEYADDPRQHAYLTDEFVPQLERELPISTEPSARVLMGASFGAVASLAAAAHAPGMFGRLLLQSGSFAGAGEGCWPRPEPLWRPVKQFVGRFLAAPTTVAGKVYVTCGVFESLICENRGLAPVLRGAGMDVHFDETLDGHNWTSWRDSLGRALPALLASARG